jgi:hypothetical protein
VSDDAKRGRELAELARQFFVWLRQNELPGLPGLKGVPFDHFQAYAGIYRKLKASQQRLLDNRVLPNLWFGEPAEQRRLQSLKLGVSYFLLVNNH